MLSEIKNIIIDGLKISPEISSQMSDKFNVSYTEHTQFGHVTTNIAMVLASSLQDAATEQEKMTRKDPKKIAQEIVDILEKVKSEKIQKIEIAGPGFINITLSEDYLLENLRGDFSNTKTLNSENLDGKNVLVEYTDPNPFKVFHIGHLMTNIIGESIARIYEGSGANVKRVNYQGDVGRHIAINIYAILKAENKKVFEDLKLDTSKSIKEKVEWLGEKYKEGYFDFDRDDKDENSNKDIVNAVADINKKIYEKSDEEINEIYDIGRKWSLDYFETLYTRLGTKFDEYIFESETAEEGKQIVTENIKPNGKGVFEIGDEGAVIYDGEKVGLHKRVFINKNGLPTYEAKDMGNINEKIKRFGASSYTKKDIDKSIVVTGNETNDYFKVIYSAADELGLMDREKLVHIGHGMMRFVDGKMSSRKGNIIAGDDLLDQIKEKLREKFDTSRITDENEKESVLDDVSIAAIKYSVLKQSIGRDVIFDFEKAISVEGDSGPYLQYTHARMSSIAKISGNPEVQILNITNENRELVLVIAKYGDVLDEVSRDVAPHKLLTYLIDLSRTANSWYAANRVVGNVENEYLAYLVKEKLMHGLDVVGIKAPNRM